MTWDPRIANVITLRNPTSGKWEFDNDIVASGADLVNGVLFSRATGGQGSPRFHLKTTETADNGWTDFLNLGSATAIRTMLRYLPDSQSVPASPTYRHAMNFKSDRLGWGSLFYMCVQKSDLSMVDALSVGAPTAWGSGNGWFRSELPFFVNKGFYPQLVTKAFANSPYAVALTDHTILANATDGAMIINLPVAPHYSWRVLVIKKVDATANNVEVRPGIYTIDGAAVYNLGQQWSTITIQSDGTNWVILSKI